MMMVFCGLLSQTSARRPRERRTFSVLPRLFELSSGGWEGLQSFANAGQRR